MKNSGQIVVVVNTSTDETAQKVRAFFDQYQAENPWCATKVKVVEENVPYTDREFDGRLKAIALSHCTEPYAILLDCDEIIPPNQRNLWLGMVRELENRRNVDALLVPVIDLIGDQDHFKSIGSKWYLHRNSPNITRGVVEFARRKDGTFDTTKSDSCELIYKDSSELVRAAPILVPDLPDFLKLTNLESGETPYVVHLGWLNLEQRLKQTEFWKKHWENREGKPNSQPKTTLADLEKIKRFRHNLADWRVT